MQFSTISVKLKGSDIPETLAAIDRVWKSTRGRGGDAPVGKLEPHVFYDERVQRMYYPMQVEERIFGIMALVAISLALLGMLGLAASAADQRTKEIGIRKALGANTGDVLKLLLWQFSKPVVWANLDRLAGDGLGAAALAERVRLPHRSAAVAVPRHDAGHGVDRAGHRQRACHARGAREAGGGAALRVSDSPHVP